jgi:hypothetical protein
MAGHSALTTIRCLRLCLGGVQVFSLSLHAAVEGTRPAQAGESAQGDAPGQSPDIDRPDHAEGTVEMMVPYQRHLGAHMKWTVLRAANADDVRRVDEIVETLRRALAKYRDYRVALNDGFAPLHPERKHKHYHFANKQRRFMAKICFDPAEPTALL